MSDIRRIVCCCSQGLGSSMIVHMNVERALQELNYSVPVEHVPLSELFPHKFDCIVVGQDLYNQAKKYSKVIVLSDLMDIDELKEKLTRAFEGDDTFFIE